MGDRRPWQTGVVTETRLRRSHQGTRDLTRGKSNTKRLLPPRHKSREQTGHQLWQKRLMQNNRT